jgi:hypothetical protein
MKEALYRFIHGHYAEVLAAGPVTLLLIGLLIAVGIDAYECVSKCREMQFRVDSPAFQGDFPQA